MNDKFNANRRRFVTTLGGAALIGWRPFHRAYGQVQKELLTLGVSTGIWGSVGWIAEAEHVFKKANVDVKVLKFDSGKTIRDSMISGRIDIGLLGTTPFIVGVVKGDLAALATAGYGGHSEAVVAGKFTGITSVAQLKGKRIASLVGSSIDYTFKNKIAPAYGLKKSDYQIVNIKMQDQVAALAARSVDAFVGGDPYVSVAVINNIGVELTDFAKYDMLPVWLAVRQPILEQHPKELMAFLHGWLMAVKIYNMQPDVAAKIIWNFYHSRGYTIKKTAVQRMLSKFDVNPNYVQGLKSYLNHQAEVLLKDSRINSMPDWGKVLDNKILREVMAT